MLKKKSSNLDGVPKYKLPSYMDDVRSFFEDDEKDQVYQLVRRYTRWFDKVKTYLALLASAFYPEGINYTAFMECLHDTNAPFNELEKQIIFHGLLAEGGVPASPNSKNVIIPNVHEEEFKNPEARLVQFDKFDKAPWEALKKHDYERVMEIPYSAVDKPLQEARLEMNIRVGRIHESRLKNYVRVQFNCISYSDMSFPYHFAKILPEETTVGELKQVVCTHMDYPVQWAKVIIKVAGESESTITDDTTTLRELQFFGGPEYEPVNAQMVYLSGVGFIDCPLLVSDTYPYRNKRKLAREELLLNTHDFSQMVNITERINNEPSAEEISKANIGGGPEITLQTALISHESHAEK